MEAIVVSDPNAGLDAAEVNRMRLEFDAVLEGMAAGLITADNIMPEERYAIQAYFSNRPIIHPLHPDYPEMGYEVTGFRDLVQGRDWAFGTNAAGQFGVYNLNVPESLAALRGGTAHLWPQDWLYYGHPDVAQGRQDFSDLGEYMEVAWDLALSARARAS
jgi:hypothetical protein